MKHRENFARFLRNPGLEAFGTIFPDAGAQEHQQLLAWFGPVSGRPYSDVVVMKSANDRIMLAIGRALMSNPKMMLLDEPSAGLAVGIVRSFVEVVKNIRKSGVGILLVEQNLEIASALAETCIVLAAGRVVWRGAAADAFKNEDI